MLLQAFLHKSGPRNFFVMEFRESANRALVIVL